MTQYRGHFSDGKTARQHDVLVETTATGLRATTHDGAVAATWPFDTLRLAEEVYHDRPARFRSPAAPDALLTVHDAAILHDITEATPQFRSRNLLGVHHGWRIVGWSAAAFATAGLLIWALPRLAEPVAAIIPQSWEEALGRKVVNDITLFLSDDSAEDRFCHGDVGLTALEDLTGRLAAGVDTPYQFNVRVVRSKVVNAFAAPGGQVVVLKGLLDKAESPEEVAGVLAHEMAHVVERHATEGIVRALGLTAIIAAISGDTASIGGKSAELGATILALSYSRDVETEADRVGVAMLNAADIRADGLAGFFERLSRGNDDNDEDDDEKGEKEMEKEKSATDGANGDKDSSERKNRLLNLFSTHPSGRARAAAIRATGTGQGAAMTSGEWRALKKVCGENE